VSSADHSEGPPDAQVTLVEYGDFQCPFCGRAFPIVAAIQKRMGKKLRFVFRNFPLTEIHPNAEAAAEMAEAAASKGKFWEMHTMLFTHQGALDAEHLTGYAAKTGLDGEWAAAAVANHQFIDKVKKDFRSGVRSGVNGTPTFFINGVRFDGDWTGPDLLEALEAAAVSR
jgi:protein-disulfide isomerase